MDNKIEIKDKNQITKDWLSCFPDSLSMDRELFLELFDYLDDEFSEKEEDCEILANVEDCF